VIILKDLGENLFVLDAIRAKNMTTAVYDARSNGAHATAAEIDLEDYNYPKEILIQVSVGAVAGSGKVDVDVESGDATAALTNTDYSFAQIAAAGVATYHYTPTRRFINVEATVTGTSVDFCITLIMGALGWGSSGQA
jgi:hypothetical protein